MEWDHEMFITDLQCRRFGRNLFQAYSKAPRCFSRCMIDRGSPSSTSDLGLVAYSCIASSARLACSERRGASILFASRGGRRVDTGRGRCLEAPPSSPTKYASFARKVKTIIWRCMVSIGGTLGCAPSQHDIQQTFPVQPSRRRPWKTVLERSRVVMVNWRSI
ncbi:hypothetical protein M9H77_21502 [Catharanthus roseus]|uniref:Uncharacterized protein n=1 Tax=Catharanthus roseus TaxID=4058 RepID=A0ACC0ANL6_CATRO|nr:hypothetical protein M9H77_21502 [Catharanthus roseus]